MAEVTIVSAKNRLELGFLEVMRGIKRDIFNYRLMLKQQIRREFSSAYRDSYLGLAWKLLLPVLPVSVYVLLQYYGIFHSTSEMPRVLYIVIGFTFWSFLSSVMTNTMNRLESQSTLLRKVNVPLCVVYFSGVGQILFDFLVRSVFLILVLLYYNQYLSLHLLWLPVLIIPFFMLSFGLGVLLSFFIIFVRDLRHIVTVLLTYGVYMSGVIFPAPEVTFLKKIFEWNPIYILIDDTRRIILGMQPLNIQFFWIWCVFALVLFVFSLHRSYLLEERVTEYL